jgi:hypothetical protein
MRIGRIRNLKLHSVIVIWPALDLRPANVMWRCVGDTVQIRIIDFEDALKFGTLITVNGEKTPSRGGKNWLESEFFFLIYNN